MKRKTTLLILCFTLFVSSVINAQKTAQQAILEMGSGINIGNTMDPPEGEGAWNNGPIQQYYFEDLKNAGFNTVRIPITWDFYTSWTAPDYPVDGAWMNRVEQVVDWGLAQGLYIIINMHHENWFWADFNGGGRQVLFCLVADK